MTKEQELPVVRDLRELIARFEQNACVNIGMALNPSSWDGTDFVCADAALHNFEQAERARRILDAVLTKARASTGGDA